MDAVQQELFARMERPASWIRLTLVGFVAAALIALPLPPGTIPWAAYAIVGAAGAYSLILLTYEPFERFDVMRTGWFLSTTDLVLITAFLVSTGGMESPWYPILYASIVAFALRFSIEETMAASTAYIVAYAGIAVWDGGIVPHMEALVVRGGFVPILGLLGVLLSQVAREETVLKRTYQELAEENEEYLSVLRGTLDATKDGILVVGEEGRVVAYNKRFQEMWDIPDDLLETGHDEELLDHVTGQLVDPEAFRQRVDELYGEQLDEESTDRIHFRDGRVFERYSEPQRLNGVVGRVWSFTDVTERYRALDALERSNEDLERFAYVASHDLREPLRMVTQYLQLLERRAEGKLTEDEEEFLHYAVDGAQRMDGLIRDLLEWSRVDRMGEELEPVEAREAVDAALVNLEMAIDEAGATVRVGDLPRVLADRTQLAQVFQNLVGNALEYAEGSKPVVRIAAEPCEDGFWRFQVEDNGPGVPEDARDRVFDVFFSQHDGEGGGTGIGLAIVKRIVERHGGEVGVEAAGAGAADGDPRGTGGGGVRHGGDVGVEDAEGGGARFWFSLPGAEEAEPEASKQAAAKGETEA